MRLWSLHPRYLDSKGLVALWREGLLGLAVLQGRTKGYTKHSQLVRFRASEFPAIALTTYLWRVHDEASARGYRFASGKLPQLLRVEEPYLTVTSGQLEFEAKHLLAKLAHRCSNDPSCCLHMAELVDDTPTEPHPLFRVVEGPIEPWEKL